MFEKLNDDSWAIILKYVELKDQLSLMQVSEDMSTTVHNHWKSIKVAHMDEEIFKGFKKQPCKMHKFLEMACESLESISMISVFIDSLLPAWQAYEFPKLRSLDCKTWNWELQHDKLTLLLSKIFPNVTKLKLNTSNNGHYVWNFTQLEELTLHSNTMDTPVLDKIFGLLPLRKLSLFPFCTARIGDVSLVSKCLTLEELLIHDYNLKYALLSNLVKLPKFHRLSFYTRDYSENYMRNLEELDQELRVECLLFNNSSFYFYDFSSYIVHFSNLRRLVIQSDNIRTNQLYQICSNLKQLQELHLIDVHDFPSATQIWNMVGACRSLKVLNISKNDLDTDFLDESSSCLFRVLKRRNAQSSPVILYAYKTRLADDPQETRDVLNHPYLIVSFDAIHIESMANTSDAFIETIFKTLS